MTTRPVDPNAITAGELRAIELKIMDALWQRRELLRKANELEASLHNARRLLRELARRLRIDLDAPATLEGKGQATQ